MAIKLIIDEPGSGLTDQSARLYYPSGFNFTLTQGQRGTALWPLAVDDSDSYAPTLGSPTYAYDPDTVRAYAGTIDTIQETWVGDDNIHVYACTCVSFEQAFDTIRVPPDAYFGQTCGFIFTDLYNKYAATLGVPVTLGTVQDGPTIDSFVIRWDRLSDLFDKLKTLAQFIWGVKMSDLTVYFQEFETTAAPFELNSYLFETGQWQQNRSDFRDRQLVQIAFTAFSTSNEMFAGDGTSGFINLFRRIDRVTSASITTSTQATAEGIFGSLSPLSPAQPSPGDTFRIGPAGEEPYTFVTALDNTTRNLILIGATVDDTAVNTFHAIQGTQIWKGIKFSLPTWENDLCNADFPVANTFVLRCKNPGEGGNGILLTTTSATFNWSASATTAGTDGVSTALRVGLLGPGDTGNDILYSSGSNQLLLAAPIEIGSSLSVAYYALGADTIAVEDSALVAVRAAVEHGSGRYDQIIVDTNNTDAISGYLEAKNALIAYKTLPKSFQFSVYDIAQLSPGQLLTISVLSPTGAPALLDGTWLIQSIQGAIDSSDAGIEELPEPYGHFKYTVTVINVPVVGTDTDFFQNLAIVTPAGSQSSVLNNVTIQQATPTLKNPATATPGSPTAGTPTTPAGQQWVQEAPGPYRQWKAKDLKVDASANTKVTSASRPFVLGDVGSTVTVTGGAGWTPGAYGITGVTAGVATLSASPAAVGTGHGEWQLSSGKLFATTWVPLASSYTKNQIIELSLNGLIISPFAPHTPGFVASGGDYEIQNGNQILFAEAVDPTADTLVALYFPSGIVKAPDGPEAPDTDGMFVAIANNASGTDQIMTSANAIAWTAVASPFDGSGGLAITTDGAGNIVAAGVVSGFILSAMYSTDQGATWTDATGYPNTDIAIDICFGAGQFVTISQGFGIVAASSDGGVTWAQTATLGAIFWQAITFGAGVYVAVGTVVGVLTDNIASSPDAASWTPHSAPTGDWGGVCFGGGKFVAVGPPFTSSSPNPAAVITSTDGASWSAQTPAGSSGDKWQFVAFGAGLYVAVGEDSVGNGQIMYSADAVTWTLVSVPDAAGALKIRFCNGLFIIAAGTVVTSPDAITWTTQSVPLNNTADVTFG